MGHGVGLMAAGTPETSTLGTRQPRLPPESSLLPALFGLLVHPGTAEAPPATLSTQPDTFGPTLKS